MTTGTQSVASALEALMARVRECDEAEALLQKARAEVARDLRAFAETLANGAPMALVSVSDVALAAPAAEAEAPKPRMSDAQRKALSRRMKARWRKHKREHGAGRLN